MVPCPDGSGSLQYDPILQILSFVVTPPKKKAAAQMQNLYLKNRWPKQMGKVHLLLLKVKEQFVETKGELTFSRLPATQLQVNLQFISSICKYAAMMSL